MGNKMKYIYTALYYFLFLQLCYCQTTTTTSSQTASEENLDSVTKPQEIISDTDDEASFDKSDENNSTDYIYGENNVYKGTNVTPEEVKDLENTLGEELDDIFGSDHPAELNIEDVKKLMTRYDEFVGEKCFNRSESLWNHLTDLRDEEKMEEKVEDAVAYNMVKGSFLKILKSVDLDEISKDDENLAETLEIAISNIGISALSSDDAKSLQRALASLETSYRDRSVDIYRDGTHTAHKKFYQPAVDVMLSEPSSYHRLFHYWTSWHNCSSEEAIENFQTYIEKNNLAAKLQGQRDGSKMLKVKYDDENLSNTLENLWLEIKPLYESLHEFLITKIKHRYGFKYRQKGNSIPAHLLGSTSGESWTSLYHIVKPYPDSNDLSKSLAEGLEEWSYCRGVDLFLKSLGLDSLPDPCVSTLKTFRYEERDSDCHPKVYDFCNGKEYRLQVCNFNGVDAMKDIYYHIGLMEYSIYYNGAPSSHHRSPHQGFAEAFGNILAIQVSMDFHLKNMMLDEHGLQQTQESEMNNLMLEALRVLPTIAYALAVDSFRWDAMIGDIPKDSWNEHWWNLRKEYQFIEPPVPRSKNDFDPAANYDIVMDHEKTPKFLGYIMSYELLKKLCAENPRVHGKKMLKNRLHQCNLFGLKSVGKKLREFFTDDGTEDWRIVYKNLTGTLKLSADALLEYFRPLKVFMDTYEEPSNPAKNQYMAIAIGIGVFSVVLVTIINLVYIMKKIKSHREKKKAARVSLKMDENKIISTRNFGHDNIGLEVEIEKL